MSYIIDKFFPFDPNGKVNYSITADKYTKLRVWCIGCGGPGGHGGSKWGLYNGGGGGSGGNGGISVSEIELLENETVTVEYPKSYNGENCAVALVDNEVVAAASNGKPGGNGSDARWTGGGDGGPGGPGGQAFDGNYINQKGTGGNRAGEPGGAGTNRIYVTKYTNPKYTAGAHQSAYGDYELPTLCFGTAGGGADGNGGAGRGVGAKGAIIIERWIEEPKMMFDGKPVQRIMLGEYDVSTLTDKVIVPLDVIANGTYEAPKGVDGYNPVTVNISSKIDTLIDGTITEISSNIKAVRDYAFSSCQKLEKVSLPNATSIGQWSFRNCQSLTNVYIPKVTSIGASAFSQCNALTKVELFNVISIGDCFYFCNNLRALIIRYTYVCRMINYGALMGTPIAEGDGYIYVPRSLVDQYKSATNWSDYASQIRAIEDYPDITGG